jgi:hypothetical protein
MDNVRSPRTEGSKNFLRGRHDYFTVRRVSMSGRRHDGEAIFAAEALTVSQSMVLNANMPK